MHLARPFPLLLSALLSILPFSAFGVNVCTGTVPGTNEITMSAVAGEASFQLANPIPATATDVKISWLTDQQLMDESAAPASADAKPFPFTLGVCGPNPSDKTKPFIQYFTPANDFTAVVTAETIVIRFVPNEPGTVTRYLRLSWKADASATAETKRTYKIIATGGVPDYAGDSRYKLWVYTGYTYLRSENDFKDGFAELLARTEIRWIDGRIALKHYHPDLYEKAVETGERCDLDHKGNQCPTAHFTIVRIYGEAGLTGTTVETTTDVTPGNETKIGGVTQAFGGSVGLGVGQTRLVSVLKPTDTSAFSILGVLRLGMISIPGTKDANGKPLSESRGAFNYSTNVRIENEPSFRDDNTKGGNFEGAYFELGWGESEQFARKKYPRLRFDGLLPINSGSDLFRFATRLQIDAPRPFAGRKTEKGSTTDNLANEIRISILFNLDLLELGKRMAGK
jgi:hypothetical protein